TTCLSRIFSQVFWRAKTSPRTADSQTTRKYPSRPATTRRQRKGKIDGAIEGDTLGLGCKCRLEAAPTRKAPVRSVNTIIAEALPMMPLGPHEIMLTKSRSPVYLTRHSKPAGP